jgi:hypothetical protein
MFHIPQGSPCRHRYQYVRLAMKSGSWQWTGLERRRREMPPVDCARCSGFFWQTSLSLEFLKRDPRKGLVLTNWLQYRSFWLVRVNVLRVLFLVLIGSFGGSID